MKNIIHTIDNKISYITINRSEKLNSLSNEVIDELIDVVAGINKLNKSRVAIITGKGDKAFIAGADIKEMSNMTKNESLKYAKKGQLLTKMIERANIPFIAAINGFALGGGCEIALACHLRYSLVSAKFGQPEVSLGLIAGFGGTQRLPRLIGKGRALEMLLTGKIITANEAYNIGLVNQVFSDNLINECTGIAKKIIKNGPNSISRTIKSVNLGLDEKLVSGLDIEADLFSNLFESKESQEGMLAFIEKRKPDFNR